MVNGVADENQPHAAAAHQLVHDRQHLRLHRGVEGGRRLVGDQQLGLGDQHHRDHRPLAHAAGNLVQPYSYAAASNGKAEATATRPHPRVRAEDCVGCRLCYNICPVDHCIAMVEEPAGRASITWDELAKSRPEVAEDWEAMEEYRKRVGIRVH